MVLHKFFKGCPAVPVSIHLLLNRMRELVVREHAVAIFIKIFPEVGDLWAQKFLQADSTIAIGVPALENTLSSFRLGLLLRFLDRTLRAYVGCNRPAPKP